MKSKSKTIITVTMSREDACKIIDELSPVLNKSMCPALKAKIDDESISLLAGYRLSFLSWDEQLVYIKNPYSVDSIPKSTHILSLSKVKELVKLLEVKCD